MTDCEQLAGELKVLEELLKQTSTEHKRREIIDRIDQINVIFRKYLALAQAQKSLTLILIPNISGHLFCTYSG